MAVRLGGGNLIDISFALASQHSSECSNRQGVEVAKGTSVGFPNCAVRVLTAAGRGSAVQPKANPGADMHQIIYLVGLIVVILAILSFFGLR